MVRWHRQNIKHLQSSPNYAFPSCIGWMDSLRHCDSSIIFLRLYFITLTAPQRYLDLSGSAKSLGSRALEHSPAAAVDPSFHCLHLQPQPLPRFNYGSLSEIYSRPCFTYNVNDDCRDHVTGCVYVYIFTCTVQYCEQRVPGFRIVLSRPSARVFRVFLGFWIDEL